MELFEGHDTFGNLLVTAASQSESSVVPVTEHEEFTIDSYHTGVLEPARNLYHFLPLNVTMDGIYRYKLHALYHTSFTFIC